MSGRYTRVEQPCGKNISPQGQRMHRLNCPECPDPGQPRSGGSADDQDEASGDVVTLDLGGGDSLDLHADEDGAVTVSQCEDCGSNDLLDADEAASLYEQEVEDPNPAILSFLRNAEAVCEDCTSVQGEGVPA